MRLKIDLSLSSGASGEIIEPPENFALSNSDVDEHDSVGTVVGALSADDPDDGAVSFSLVMDSRGWFDVDGDDLIVVGVPDFATAASHTVTLRATGSGGGTLDQDFEITINDVVEAPPEEPPGDVIVDNAANYEVQPTVVAIDEAIAFHGKKKATGSVAKFLMDIGPAEPGRWYHFTYTPDFSRLANGGVTAMVAFGLRTGNDFHFVGLKGNGSSDVNAYQVSGNNKWNQTSGFTLDDGGAAVHGSLAGPNHMLFRVSVDGETYAFRTSADGVTWSDEYVAANPDPLASVTGATNFGIGMFLDVNDAGSFRLDGALTITNEHRYWRLFCLNNNGDADFISVGEWEAYEIPYAGVNVLTGGTITASSEFSGSFPAANAVNDLYHDATGTRWASASTGGTNEWLRYDLGSGVEKEIRSIGILSAGNAEFDQSVKDFRVEFSDDGTTFATYWSDSLTFTRVIQFKRSIHPDHVPSYTGSPYGLHTYWRVLNQASDGAALSAAEVEFKATTGGADQATGGTPTVNASTLGNAANIYDNNNSTFWAINGGAGSWTKYQFASPVTVGQITWRIRGDANPTHAPNDFLVQFSGDNVKWTTAWQQFDETAWSLGEQRTFTSPDYV